jgi:hypothetical protein
MEWYRRDKEAVAAALQRGERPDLATTMASGPLDELVALHEELGIFAILDEVEAQRTRAGMPDKLLLRTLATLPFVEQASLSGGSSVLFREPAVLLQLGWAPVQIRSGSNGRHRHPEGRQEESLPCHSNTLRDALRRVRESAWQKAQEAGVQSPDVRKSSSPDAPTYGTLRENSRIDYAKLRRITRNFEKSSALLWDSLIYNRIISLLESLQDVSREAI